MSILKKIIIPSAVVLLTACSSHKEVIYLSEAENIPAETLMHSHPSADPIITVGDLLNIRVMSADAAAAAPFNRNMYAKPNGDFVFAQAGNARDENADIDFYLVNSSGSIDFPLIGSIEVAGKTKSQVAQQIQHAIYPKYLKQEPTVEIRLMNFRVTVLGSVNNPGQYSSASERLNLLEAIAMAGDLTMQGERENILLYRTNADGTHQIQRLNLNDRNVLLSPYFTLQQNDIIYVTPNKSARQGAWQMPQSLTTTLSIVGGASALAALIVSIINVSK